MKNIAAILTILAASICITSSAEEKSSLLGAPETTFTRNDPGIKIQVALQQISLSNDDTLDDRSNGLELQLQSWPMKGVGFAFVLGTSEWDLEISPDLRDVDIPVTTSEGASSIAGRSSVVSQGDITLYPIGFSAISDIPVTSYLSINPHAGLRYVIIDADATAVKTVGGRTIKDSYDSDNAILGVIGIDARVAVTDLVNILIGIGYQFDISSGEISASFGDDGGVAHEVELDAYFGQVAAALSF